MKTASLQKLFLFSFFGIVSLLNAAPKSTILTDIQMLEEVKIPALHFDESTGLAVAEISSFQQSLILRKSHEMGRCGGFELLSDEITLFNLSLISSKWSASEQRYASIVAV